MIFCDKDKKVFVVRSNPKYYIFNPLSNKNIEEQLTSNTLYNNGCQTNTNDNSNSLNFPIQEMNCSHSKSPFDLKLPKKYKNAKKLDIKRKKKSNLLYNLQNMRVHQEMEYSTNNDT